MRFSLTLSLAAAPLLAQAVSPSHLARAHRRNSVPDGNQLQKRGALAGFGTWFEVGLGACGWWNNENDFIIAMNSNQFPQDGYPSSICGKQVGITGPAGYAVATVADECPQGNGNCNYGDMDMSKGLFKAVFGDLGVGKGAITWDWLDGSGGGNTGGNTGGGSGGGNNGGGNTGGGSGGGDSGSGNNGGGDNGGYNGGDNGGNTGNGNNGGGDNGGNTGSGNNGGSNNGDGNNGGGDNGGYNNGDGNNGGGNNGGYNGGGDAGQQSQAPPTDPAPSSTTPPPPPPTPTPSSCRKRAPPSKA